MTSSKSSVGINPNVEITKSKTMSYTWNFAVDPSETQNIITLEGETFDFDKYFIVYNI